MRFFFVDRVDELKPGESIRGIKNITYNEDFLEDHFPDNPIYPGTLIVEALAQIAGFLVECTFDVGTDAPRRAVLAQIEKAKFYGPVRPGDQVQLHCEMESTLEGAAQIKAEARVAGKRVASVTLLFVLWKVDSEKVHRQRRELYRIWTQNLKLDFPIR